MPIRVATSRPSVGTTEAGARRTEREGARRPGGAASPRTAVALVASMLLAALLAATSASLLAATRASARSRVLLRSSSGIAGIAADGHMVAVAVDAGATCWHVVEANVNSGRVRAITSLRSGPTCTSDRGFMTFLPGPVIGLAGTRAAWVVYDAGNELYPSLVTGAPGARERVVAGAADDAVDPDTGPFLGPVTGSGSLLAYDDYDRAWLPAGCDPVEDRCTLGPPSGVLRAVGGGRIGAGEGALLASVDAGRAVILRGDGSVAVVARDGHEVVSVHPPAAPQSAALQGRRLVVRAGARLLVYRLDGTLAASYSIPRASGRIDIWATTVVYAARRRVMAIQLERGARRTLAIAPRGAHMVGVEIEGRAVSYAYDTRMGHGVVAVHFIPPGA